MRNPNKGKIISVWSTGNKNCKQIHKLAMPVLIFNKEEYDLLAKVCSNESSKLNIKELDEGELKITFSDQVAEILVEKIQDAYVYEGFDKSYDPNRKGKLYENLIDKFYSIGW